MNCRRSLASSPPIPATRPCMRAIGKRKRGKVCNGPRTAVRRGVKEKGNTCEHLFEDVQGDIIRSGKQLSRRGKEDNLMRELDHNQHSVYLLYCHLTEVIREYIKSQGEKR